MNWELEPRDMLYKMSYLKNNLKDNIEVAVFRDTGWGDDSELEPSYSIIINGNGQITFGDMSEDCFNLLLKDGYLEHNTLQTSKDRGYHKYIGPINIGYCGWEYRPNKNIEANT